MMEEVELDDTPGPDLTGIEIPLEAFEVTDAAMGEMYFPQKKRRVVQRVDSSGTDMEIGDTPFGILQQPEGASNGIVAPNKVTEEDRPMNVLIGPDFPGYLQSVVDADQRHGVDKLVEQLCALKPEEYCEDYFRASQAHLMHHAAGLCAYICWLATKYEAQQEIILNLRDQVEQLSTAEDYDRLLKEKSSWTSSQKQLESELNEEKKAREKAELEQDKSRATVATNATLIQQHLQTLTNANQELSALREALKKVDEERAELSAKALQVQSEFVDMKTRLGQANDDRDEALQDLENMHNRMEGLIQRVTDLEAQLDDLQGVGPNKPMDI
ncbi:unnamed protein product [Calypogeia fissa]